MFFWDATSICLFFILVLTLTEQERDVCAIESSEFLFSFISHMSQNLM